MIWLAAFLACGPKTPPEAAPAADPEVSDPFTLKLYLYRWVPDHPALVTWVQDRFNAEYAEQGFQVEIWTGSEEAEPYLSYNAAATVAALEDGVYHAIEIDSMILGDVQEAIQPAPVLDRLWFDRATEGMSLDGTLYGVPHWTCGFFMFTYDFELSEVFRASELVAAMDAAGYTLGGQMKGTWDTPAIYLDAVRDADSHADLSAAMDLSALDEAVLGDIRSVVARCGEGACEDDDVKPFLNGEVDVFFGYSERLNAMIQEGDPDLEALRIITAPLGDGDWPVSFTDGLVVSKTCTGRCLEAFTAFADFYTRDATYDTLLLGKDTEAGVPRYLLPASATAMVNAVLADRFYTQLEVELRDVRPLPNQGMVDWVEVEAAADTLWPLYEGEQGSAPTAP